VWPIIWKPTLISFKPPLHIGQKLIVPQERLSPAQVRYCPIMFANKNVALEGDLYRGGDLLKVIAVSSDQGYFYSLLDHHHHLLKALQEGARNFEVIVDGIWTENEYHQRLLKNQQMFSLDITFYCRTLKGSWQEPFSSMEDLLHHGEKDPLRDFLGQTKIYDFYENGQLIKTSHPAGPALYRAIWRKGLGTLPLHIIKTPSFAEFILSDILRAYRFEETGDIEDIETARNHLKQAKDNPPEAFPFVEWEGFHLDWLEIIG
jgi:hypothetical protein